MTNFYTVKEARIALAISEELTEDIINYAFKNNKLFKVFKVGNKYLIDKRSFKNYLNN